MGTGVTTPRAAAAVAAVLLACITSGWGPPPVAASSIPVTPSASCQPAAPASASVDQSLTRLFSHRLGSGWIGGDATYSTALPNGTEAFDFSDTLIGTARPDGQATIAGTAHNSELVGPLSDLRTEFRGTTTSPRPLIPDGRGTDQWQVAATYVEQGRQLIFVNEFAPVTGSVFDRFTGRSGIAVLNVGAGGTPTFVSVAPLPTDRATQWGTAVVQNATFTYVYGSTFWHSSFRGMKVARVQRGATLDTGHWQYWNGAQWVIGESNARRLAGAVLFSGVAEKRSGVGYVAVSVAHGGPTTRSVAVSYACTPVGPWSPLHDVYAIPQVLRYRHVIAYSSTFHPELSAPGTLVISYDIDSTEGLAALRRDVHQYQPQFLVLR
jgi:hypothetical protein